MLASFILFVIAIIFAFYIPGNLLLKPLKLHNSLAFVLSFVVGMVFWGWQGFIFGHLNLRILSYVYLVAILAGWIYVYKPNFKHIIPRISFSSAHIIPFSIIGIGIVMQLSSLWFNGMPTEKGLYFCCGNLSDNMYHVALVNELTHEYPPFEPGMYGKTVVNYHYLSNAVPADLIRVFKLPLFDTDFRFMPLFVSLFLGLSLIALATTLNLGNTYRNWLLFLFYFGSDLIYALVSFIRGEFNFHMSSLENGAMFLQNLPRAYSIVVFIVAITLLIPWFKKRTIYTDILLSLLFAGLIGFKVYTGLFTLTGLGFLSLYYLWKKDYSRIWLFLASGIFSLLLYIPVNKSAGGLYFTGLYIFENFIVQPWLSLDRLEMARQIYASHNSHIRVAQYELIYIVTYIATVFGLKNFALFQNKKSLSLFPTPLHIFLIPGLLVSIVLGLFFQQTSGGSNTFNFLVSVFLMSSLYAALSLSYWLKKLPKTISRTVIIVIILISSPRLVHDTADNIFHIQSQKGLMISNGELDALSYLNANANNQKFVLAKEVNKNQDGEALYIPTISNTHSFFLSNNILQSHNNVDTARMHDTERILQSTNPAEVKNLLYKNNVGYIYLQGSYLLPVELKDTTLFKIIYNDPQAIKILKVL